MTCQLATAIMATSKACHVDREESSKIATPRAIDPARMPKPCTGEYCHNNRDCAKMDCPGNSSFHAGEHYFVPTCHGRFRKYHDLEHLADQRERHDVLNAYDFHRPPRRYCRIGVN
jgi:predicted alternative tryptophan synthase beta-subunit